MEKENNKRNLHLVALPFDHSPIESNFFDDPRSKRKKHNIGNE